MANAHYLVTEYPPPQDMKVEYSNLIQVSAGEQEVYLDFFRIHPEAPGADEGSVRTHFVARMLITSEHARRLHKALVPQSQPLEMEPEQK